MKRHGLVYHTIRQVEDRRVDALSKSNVAEHLVRVQAAMVQYNITEPKFIFNRDQSDAFLGTL